MTRRASHPETPASPTPETRDPRRWLVLFFMSLGTLIVFLDLTVVNVALPAISFDIGASTADLQWVIDGYVLALAGLLMLAGSIGDRYGRRRGLSAGLLLFGAGAVIGATAHSIETLIAGRVVMGLGAAFVLPATLSIVTNTFDRDERPKAIAVWTAVSGMGIGLGPAIGGYLVDRWGWSAAFWIHLPVLAVAMLGQIFFIRESRDPRRVGLDVPGALTATAGLTALVYGIIHGAEAGWTSGVIVTSFGVAAVLLSAFVLVEQRVAHPMLPLRFFRERDFTASVVVLALSFFAGAATFFFLTQFFQIVQGRDPFEAGLLILPNAAAIIVASSISPKLVERIGPRRVVMTAALIMTAGLMLFSTFDADSSALYEIACIMVFGFGFGLCAPVITDSVMAAVPLEDAGVGSAVNDVSRELGNALGVAIIGSFMSGLYRGDVVAHLDSGTPDHVRAAARDGIGVLVSKLPTLAPDVGRRAFAVASDAFIDAMASGARVAAVAMLVAVVVAAWLLPNKARTHQMERTDDELVVGDVAVTARDRQREPVLGDDVLAERRLATASDSFPDGPDS